MKLRLLLFLVLAPALVTVLALPVAGHAQPAPTPILGEPVVVTPLVGGTTTAAERPEPAAPSPTAAAASTGPDTCERNETRTAACPIALDAVNGPYTFWPAGDQDWYRMELSNTGLQTVITVRGTAGLDLLTTLSRDDGTPLGTITSPAISTTLSPEVVGGVVIRVENRDPGAGEQDQYNLEVRQALPPQPTAPPVEGGAALPPDALENNWSPATAATIAPGVVYDLNLVCPVAWGCAGGDHDYLRLPVKAGVRYLIATFDLGPGVDTVLDLFWGDEARPLAANDDARAGASFLSVLRWMAPADGEALLRIAPRTGGLTPIVDDTKAGTYRLAVALAESDLARQLEDRIAEQTNAPTPAPTARPAAAGGTTGSTPPAASAPTAPATATQAISTDAPTGTARVSAAETVLRESPSAAAPVIQSLPAEAVVTLLGQSSGGWVRVQPVDGVVPGWVRGVDLMRAAETAPTATAAPAPASTLTTPDATPVPVSHSLVVERLNPLPPPAPSAAPQRLTVALSIQVATSSAPRSRSTGQPEPTPKPADLTPVVGVRVHLVNAFGDVLTEAVTPATGRINLTTEVAAGTALFVILPATGLRTPVDLAQPSVLVVLPTEEVSR